ncbi:MAG TPA: glycosyltransferase family A protein [Candidatus Acidoferrales bacterium]|nr:glycosyltransferase family A protein [Candidatus Acidoferrales bacterium]
MDLDVILATRNRCSLLRIALESLLRAEVPAGLRVAITVVDNNSSDETAEVVREFSCYRERPVRYLREPRTGKSYALNAGIRSTTGDLAGFIDDDEQIEASWYASVAEAFRDLSLDFIGGPYLPHWAAPAPHWLPRQARGIIGCFEFSDVPRNYGDELPGAVMFGGNAVIRRPVLDRVGPYRTDLVLHADQEMFERLLARGARGMYLPQLAIYHLIPRERLQKSYFRRWMWRAGPAYAQIHRPPSGVPRIAGVPRYLFRKMAQSLLRWASPFVVRSRASGCSSPRASSRVSGRASSHESGRFEAELDLIHCASLALAHFRMRRSKSNPPRLADAQRRRNSPC